jgi:hypothetical protein
VLSWHIVTPKLRNWCCLNAQISTTSLSSKLHRRMKLTYPYPLTTVPWLLSHRDNFSAQLKPAARSTNRTDNPSCTHPFFFFFFFVFPSSYGASCWDDDDVLAATAFFSGSGTIGSCFGGFALGSRS